MIRATIKTVKFVVVAAVVVLVAIVRNGNELLQRQMTFFLFVE